MILSVLNFLEQFCNLHKSKVYYMPIVNKKCDSYMYFLISDFTIQKKKRLENYNIRVLACKKKPNKTKGKCNKNIPDIRLYNSIFSNG